MAEDLARCFELNASKAQAGFEEFCRKYDREFPEDDIVNLHSHRIVHDRGFLKSMRTKRVGFAAFGKHRLRETGGSPVFPAHGESGHTNASPESEKSFLSVSEKSFISVNCSRWVNKIEEESEPSDAETLSSDDDDDDDDDDGNSNSWEDETEVSEEAEGVSGSEDADSLADDNDAAERYGPQQGGSADNDGPWLTIEHTQRWGRQDAHPPTHCKTQHYRFGRHHDESHKTSGRLLGRGSSDWTQREVYHQELTNRKKRHTASKLSANRKHRYSTSEDTANRKKRHSPSEVSANRNRRHSPEALANRKLQQSPCKMTVTVNQDVMDRIGPPRRIKPAQLFGEEQSRENQPSSSKTPVSLSSSDHQKEHSALHKDYFKSKDNRARKSYRSQLTSQLLPYDFDDVDFFLPSNGSGADVVHVDSSPDQSLVISSEEITRRRKPQMEDKKYPVEPPGLLSSPQTHRRSLENTFIVLKPSRPEIHHSRRQAPSRTDPMIVNLDEEWKEIPSINEREMDKKQNLKESEARETDKKPGARPLRTSSPIESAHPPSTNVIEIDRSSQIEEQGGTHSSSSCQQLKTNTEAASNDTLLKLSPLKPSHEPALQLFHSVPVASHDNLLKLSPLKSPHDASAEQSMQSSPPVDTKITEEVDLKVRQQSLMEIRRKLDRLSALVNPRNNDVSTTQAVDKRDVSTTQNVVGTTQPNHNGFGIAQTTRYFDVATAQNPDSNIVVLTENPDPLSDDSDVILIDDAHHEQMEVSPVSQPSCHLLGNTNTFGTTLEYSPLRVKTSSAFHKPMDTTFVVSDQSDCEHAQSQDLYSPYGHVPSVNSLPSPATFKHESLYRTEESKLKQEVDVKEECKVKQESDVRRKFCPQYEPYSTDEIQEVLETHSCLSFANYLKEKLIKIEPQENLVKNEYEEKLVQNKSPEKMIKNESLSLNVNNNCVKSSPQFEALKIESSSPRLSNTSKPFGDSSYPVPYYPERRERCGVAKRDAQTQSDEQKPDSSDEFSSAKICLSPQPRVWKMSFSNRDSSPRNKEEKSENHHSFQSVVPRSVFNVKADTRSPKTEEKIDSRQSFKPALSQSSDCVFHATPGQMFRETIQSLEGPSLPTMSCVSEHLGEKTSVDESPDRSLQNQQQKECSDSVKLRRRASLGLFSQSHKVPSDLVSELRSQPLCMSAANSCPEAAIQSIFSHMKQTAVAQTSPKVMQRFRGPVCQHKGYSAYESKAGLAYEPRDSLAYEPKGFSAYESKSHKLSLEENHTSNTAAITDADLWKKVGSPLKSEQFYHRRYPDDVTVRASGDSPLSFLNKLDAMKHCPIEKQQPKVNREIGQHTELSQRVSALYKVTAAQPCVFDNDKSLVTSTGSVQPILTVTEGRKECGRSIAGVGSPLCRHKIPSSNVEHKECERSFTKISSPRADGNFTTAKAQPHATLYNSGSLFKSPVGTKGSQVQQSNQYRAPKTPDNSNASVSHDSQSQSLCEDASQKSTPSKLLNRLRLNDSRSPLSLTKDTLSRLQLSSPSQKRENAAAQRAENQDVPVKESNFQHMKSSPIVRPKTYDTTHEKESLGSPVATADSKHQPWKIFKSKNDKAAPHTTTASLSACSEQSPLRKPGNCVNTNSPKPQPERRMIRISSPQARKALYLGHHPFSFVSDSPTSTIAKRSFHLEEGKKRRLENNRALKNEEIGSPLKRRRLDVAIHGTSTPSKGQLPCGVGAKFVMEESLSTIAGEGSDCNSIVCSSDVCGLEGVGGSECGSEEEDEITLIDL